GRIRLGYTLRPGAGRRQPPPANGLGLPVKLQPVDRRRVARLIADVARRSSARTTLARSDGTVRSGAYAPAPGCSCAARPVFWVEVETAVAPHGAASLEATAHVAPVMWPWTVQNSISIPSWAGTVRTGAARFWVVRPGVARIWAVPSEIVG